MEELTLHFFLPHISTQINNHYAQGVSQDYFHIRQIDERNTARITKLSNSNLNDADNINCGILKKYANTLIKPLIPLVNLSISSSISPLEWKKAVVPIR